MVSSVIAKLEKQGKLKKQKSGLVQVEALLRESMFDLREVRKIVHLAERATYLLAYTAMLKAGRALLLLNGYVPDDGAQHKTVVEVTSAILGNEYKLLMGQFEIMRRKRNEITYEAGVLLSKSEAEKAFKDALELVKKISALVKSANPQLELKFGLD